MLKFFQNRKLSSFFIVKMKKKKKNNNFTEKKNKSLNFAKSNAHRKTNAGGSFETRTFFFSLIPCLFLCDTRNINAVSGMIWWLDSRP